MRRRKRRKGKRAQRPFRSKRRPGYPILVTPEGDTLLVVRNHYRHNNLAKIRQILTEANDFGLEADDEAEADGELYFPWFEPGPRKPKTPALFSRRILAHLTLTPDTLTVETMSRPRMEACDKRLAQLLGEYIRFIKQETESLEKAAQKSEPAEPVELPPELIAKLEEQMLQQWLDESIPALGGLTPRQAVKTPAGRQQVLELLEYVEQRQQSINHAPGSFSPDYSKVKKMLGL